MLSKGFTLIELLVVMGIIAILAAVVIVAINPARQFAQARQSQRMSNVTSVLNAIGQNIADNKGVFTCTAGVLPAIATFIGSTVGYYNVYGCIIPTYMAEIPYDPGNPIVFNTGIIPHVISASDYFTGYTIMQNIGGRITVCAQGGVEQSIASSTAICVTR